MSAYDDGGVYLSHVAREQYPRDGSAAPVSASGYTATLSVTGAYVDHDAAVAAVALAPGGAHFASASVDASYVAYFALLCNCHTLLWVLNLCW